MNVRQKKDRKTSMNLRPKLALHAIVICIVFSHIAKAENEPLYLKHRSDFVQQVYSSVLVGFAFERKCSFLEKSKQNDYEKKLNFASEIFYGYLLSKKIVGSSTEALNYAKEMVLGTIRYAGVSECDSAAKDRVNKGFETAENFMSIIDSELKKEAQ